MMSDRRSRTRSEEKTKRKTSIAAHRVSNSRPRSLTLSSFSSSHTSIAMMRRRRCLHGHLDILILGLVSHFQQRHQTDAVPCTSAQHVHGNGTLERHLFGSEFRRRAARHARRALCLAFDTICTLLTRALCITHGTAHTHALCEDDIRKQGVPFESCPTSNSSAFFSLSMLQSAASNPHSDGYMSREEPVPRRGRHRQILETTQERNRKVDVF